MEQAWLPEKHLTDMRLAQSFAAILETWCAHWFAGTQWVVSDHWTRVGQTSGKMETIFETHNGFTTALIERGRLAVAAAMLGLPIDKGMPAKADGQLIAKIADKALDDLADRLAALPATSPQVSAVAFYIPTDWPRFELKIGPKGKPPILLLQADRQLLVRVAQSMAAPPRVLPSLSARHDAVESKPLSIGARIGSAQLTLAELQGLTVGDVITLDQPVQSSFGLTVDGVETLPSAVLIKPDTDGLTLQLTRSVS